MTKTPTIRYLGFRTTAQGREYSLRVIDGLTSRIFVMVITHADFASREASFQDAPDLCFTKLQQDLIEDPALAPGDPSVLQPRDFVEYRQARVRPVSTRRRAPAAAESPSTS